MSDFSSIYISGNLISYDLLERFNTDLEHTNGQKAKDFGFDSSINMRQEIGRAWEDASRQWTAFMSRIDRLKESDKGLKETHTHWMMPFFSILGYNLEKQEKVEEGEKQYEISHCDVSRDNFPILINSFRDSLNEKPEGNRLKMSPHSTVQNYLNNSEHLFGLVTNGLELRLLRDTGRISKPVYAEFNLVKIFDESIYAEFALLYRLLHASRMPQRKEQASESFIEQYHQDAIESGGRIREQLSGAMEQSIKLLGKGLLQHPMNNELRQQIADGFISEEKYYHVLLRLIYRIIFLMTIEERKLVYPENINPSSQRLSDVYDLCYSIERLRKLSATRNRIEGKQHDLWMRLMQTMRLFEDDRLAQKLGLRALGTGLFERTKISPFDICMVNNSVLLEAIFRLSYFENENKTMQRINYRQLDVEEFGSVYQGLLDYKIAFEKGTPESPARWDLALQGSTERGKSGTHYTPEELVQPLIKHSLDYLIADRKKIIDEQIKYKRLIGIIHKDARQQLVHNHLLSLKVCDVACGSGHILISAARRIAEISASIIEEEEQPNPTALRRAKREAIRQCIYGVDFNPMAVELCKVALWLEAHNPCEPLNFLDHHIKCGDAIVGLAHRAELENGISTEAFKALPGDDRVIASAFAKRNRQEILQKEQTKLEFEENYDQLYDSITAAFDLWKRLPENTPEEIYGKERQYSKLTNGAHLWKIKTLADIQVAQFFVPKTEKTKDLLITEGQYRILLKSKTAVQSLAASKATATANEKNFFHWFIEFPEVFNDGGFHCILGNPPYLGGSKISGSFGNSYLNVLQSNFIESTGRCDLVGYFFRRIFSIIQNNGYSSLISTNTISQGDTRKSALEFIIKNMGVINFAIKATKWPGKVAVEVSLLSLTKVGYSGKCIIGTKVVNSINSYLEEPSSISSTVFTLKANENLAFEGVKIMGVGFTLEPKIANELIQSDFKNKQVLFPYLNGDDLNSTVDQKAQRWVINFYDWSEQKAKEYTDCFSIVEEKVKPVRLLQNDIRAKEHWWKFQRPRPELQKAIKYLENVIVTARTSNTNAICIVPTNQILNSNLTVIALEGFEWFCLLQSSISFSWAYTYSTKLESRLIYQPTDVIGTLPFRINLNEHQRQSLKITGELYYVFRNNIMMRIHLGLTKTYNLFHERELTPMAVILTQQGKLGEKKYKEYLSEHGGMVGGVFKPEFIENAEKAVEMIIQLRKLHKQMDEAVLGAYGWGDISLQHNFYEVDYLPENDRVRYTIHPDARKEILKRLLELNHKIHEE